MAVKAAPAFAVALGSTSLLHMTVPLLHPLLPIFIMQNCPIYFAGKEIAAQWQHYIGTATISIYIFFTNGLSKPHGRSIRSCQAPQGPQKRPDAFSKLLIKFFICNIV